MAPRPAQTTPSQEVDQLLASELLGAAGERVAPLPDTPGIHVCPACELPFVVAGPVHEVIGCHRVRLDLHCVNCGWATTAEHDDHALAELDLHADRAFADLLWALEVVWIANEDAAIARFAAALQADAILPEDFS
ncbi:MAG: hypothetical protein JWM71_1046 [Solirubrobacteraceae bacterium]|nr:hypothetical protein [Solirubrobacteraceae bacterium]